MTVPGRTTMFLACALGLVLVGAVAVPALVPLVLLADALLVGACLLEGRALAKARVHVERAGWARIQIDVPSDLVYRIENRGPRSLVVSIRQPWPASFESASSLVQVPVGAGDVVQVALGVTPRQRGRVPIPGAQVDIRVATDLARRRWDLDDSTVLSVYPNLREVARYETLRRHHALRQFGIHRMRLIGSGREFEQLREYLPDDDFRDVNWKATARHHKPVTSIYQAERSQEVMLCLDCSRMMANPIGTGPAGTRTVLDRAIGASIVLAHVCHRAGDRVGLALFRDTVMRYLKPAGGTAALTRIVEELVDAGPEPVFPSFTALATALRANQKRRSIVFLFTDLNDPQLATNLAQVLPLVSRRHVFVVLSLRDPVLEQVSAGPAREPRGLYQVLAARHLALERGARIGQLLRAGVQVLDVDADSLTVGAINQYLSIKMRQML